MKYPSYEELVEKYSKRGEQYKPKNLGAPPYSIFGLPSYFEYCDGARLVFVTRDTEWPRVFYIYNSLKVVAKEKKKVENLSIHPLEMPGLDAGAYMDAGKIKLKIGNTVYIAAKAGWVKEHA